MSVYILQIDTATSTCAVALSKDGECIYSQALHEPNVHASKLTLLIQEVILAAGITLAELSAVAVSMGPGSYTGLRIGVSTAKGLCYALDIPLLGINTLSAMAQGFLASQKLESKTNLFLPMIDARRMEVYTEILNDQLEILVPTAAEIITEHSFDTWIDQGFQLHLFGSGADKFQELFSTNSNIKIYPNVENSASHLTRAAYAAYQAEKWEDLAYFEPYYLKDFVVTTSQKKVGL